MKNNDIINNLTDDNIIDDIQADINAELEKSEPDYDKIAELTSLITEITGNNISDKEIAENILKITEEYDSQKKRNKIKIIYRLISALSACVVLVLAMNAYTMVSFGDNIFKTIVEMTQSGFSIDFSGYTEITTQPQQELTTSMTKATTPIVNTTVAQTYPVTMIDTTVAQQNPVTTAQILLTTAQDVSTVATTTTSVVLPGNTEKMNLGDIISEKCSEIGIMPCHLNYLSTMELKDFSYEENEVSTDCYFTFDDEDRQLDIIIEQYNNAEDIPNVLIPSNQDGYFSMSCDIGEIFLFDEGTHITAVFIYKNSVYTVIGHNFSFNDIKEIVQMYSSDHQN